MQWQQGEDDELLYDVDGDDRQRSGVAWGVKYQLDQALCLGSISGETYCTRYKDWQ